MEKILIDINLRKNEYDYIYRILKTFDAIEENISFNEKYLDYFMELFKNINKYEPLSNKHVSYTNPFLILKLKLLQ